MQSIFRPLHCSLRVYGVCGILALSLFGIRGALASQPAGGFWEATSSATAQPPLTASQIAQFMPSTRSSFTFPAPYNTIGVRVTLPSDCGGTNCVQYISYSYWANMNNSAGSNTMYIMVGLRKSQGGSGPTLYQLNKTTDQVTKVGPIFTDSHVNDSGDGMYFSHTMPYALYYISNNDTTFNYVNVLTHQETQVFDVKNYNANDHIFQCGTSFDDQVTACSLENSSWTVTGCIVYNGKGNKGFQFYSSPYGMNECQPGADGKYIMFVEENARPGQDYGSTVIINAQTGAQTVVLHSIGGAGHYALGYGYYLQHNNNDPTYDSMKLWDVNNLTSGSDVWDQPYAKQCNYNPTVCAQTPSHPSWLNAVPASVQPIAHQYVCDSTANAIVKPFSNQVFCYNIDSSVAPADQRTLIVAPTMSNSTASGGCADGNGAYGNEPKGNIDPTGHYFIWSSNLDSTDNCQIFIVKIPTSQFPYPPPIVTPPRVNITNPANASTVFGTVAAKANVSADVQIANVTWKIDGQQVDSTNTVPYTYNLNTDNYAMGTHALTAVATDIAGNTGTATNDFVIAQAPAATGKGSGGGSLALLSLAALGLLAVLGLVRKRG